MRKISSLCAVIFCLTVVCTPVLAAVKPVILFVPHDDRPVSFHQTADTARKAGYSLLTPPQALLGNRDFLGDPDALWSWVFAEAKQVDAVVLSSDALLYGSLVASRKHGFDEPEVLGRADNFARLKKENPRLKVYVFGSIMRTPRSGAASGSEEPSYYAKYGADIFTFTALNDKAEVSGLTRGEKRELRRLASAIPKEAIDDWMNRRGKNFAANQKLVELARAGDFDYLALGRDDNAPFSQTNKESRALDKVSADLGETKFQTLSGIDEMGAVLLARAVNDLRWDIPLVFVEYADGAGAKTVPSYANEEIGQAVRAHLLAAGALPAFSDKRADFVLLVNTNRDGATYEANYPNNTVEPRENTVSFSDRVAHYLDRGKKVAVADIAFANGADNALMAELGRRGALPALLAYSGWNTANNSAGYVIGQGILGKGMKDPEKNALLAVRLLDDWAYQANVRQIVASEPGALDGGGYGKLGRAKQKVVLSAKEKMAAFAADHMTQFPLEEITVDFPWDRMFEIDVRIE